MLLRRDCDLAYPQFLSGEGANGVCGEGGCGEEAGAGSDGDGNAGGRGAVRPQPPINNITPARTKIGWRM